MLTWYWRSADNGKPVNDLFASRTKIAGASGRVIATNQAATTEPLEPIHGAGGSAFRSVWWSWTAPSSGPAVVHTGGSSFDTVLGVYVGQSLEQLEKVAGDSSQGATSYG